MVQAGTSDGGQDLAAEVADVLFATTQTIKAGQALRHSLHNRLVQHGREPDAIKLMPGLVPIIGTSQQEADDKFDRLQSLVHPEVGLQLLGEMLGSIDLSGYPLDGPLPEITTTIGSHTALKLFTEMAKRENLTIRQLICARSCAGTTWCAGRRSGSPTISRNGLQPAPPMAST